MSATNIRIENRIGIKATSDAVWEVLSDVGSWGGWNPVYPQAAGRIAIGGVLTLDETVAGLKPRHEVTVKVTDWTPRAQLIWLDRRGFLCRSLRYFEIEELAPGACIFANGEVFAGWRGEDFAAKHRKKLRQAYLAFGEALRLRVEGA